MTWQAMSGRPWVEALAAACGDYVEVWRLAGLARQGLSASPKSSFQLARRVMCDCNHLTCPS